MFQYLLGIVLLFIPASGFASESKFAFNGSDTLLANDLFLKAILLKDDARFDSSLVCYEQAGALLEQAGKWSKSVMAYNHMSEIYWTLANYEKSISYAEKALSLGRKHLGKSHSHIGASYLNIGFCHFQTGKFEKSWDYYQKAVDNTTQSLGDQDPQMADIYIKAGFYFWHKGDFEKQMNYYEEALEIFRNAYGEEHPKTAHTYDCIGFCYLAIGDYDLERFNYQKGLAIKQRILRKDHPDLGINYNNLGINFGRTGDYHNELEYLQKALDILIINYGEKHDLVDITYNNIGLCYGKLKDFENELFYLKKSLALTRSKYNEEHPGVDIATHNIGKCYRSKKDYNNAYTYFEKSLSLFKQIRGKEHPYVARAYEQIGHTFSEQGLYHKALPYFEKVHDIELKVYGEKHPQYASAIQNLGQAYKNIGAIEQALAYYQIALNIRHKVYGDVHHDLISSYQNIGKLFYLKKEYSKAIEYFEKAIVCLDQLKKSYASQKSKQFQLSEKYSLFENMIYTLWGKAGSETSKADLKKAFTYLEKSKANLLQEALNIANAENFSDIPDSLLKEERYLTARITYYDKKRYKENSKGDAKNDSIINVYFTKVFDLKHQHNLLIDQFEKSYPDYYQLKYNTHVISLENLQNKRLQTDQTLLEYFVGDSSIFIFLIQPDNYEVYRIKKDFPLNTWVTQMRKGLYNYHLSGNKDEVTYLSYSDTLTIASVLLYKKLIAPFKEKLSKKLIIIPDGALNYIPFEALLIKTPKASHHFKNHHYLLNEYEISYCYSATLLEEMKTKKIKAPKNLLAFAPSFKQKNQLYANVEKIRNDLGPLDYNIPEAKQIISLIGGDLYTGEQATQEQFIHLAKQYQILHLATHGKANDKAGAFSFLAFTEINDNLDNERLYVRDLYNLDLNAELVVLSACETGIGELQKGEGVISLARGFSYAGAKSMVTTLWSVNDKNTKRLMEFFYQNIKNGMEKDAALRIAKIDFMAQQSHLGAHPFYWAGFIPVGNMAPVQLPFTIARFMKYIIGFGILFILFRMLKQQF